MKRKVNCDELSLEKTLLGLPQKVNVVSETWLNSRVKVNSTYARSFSTRVLLRDGRYVKREFHTLQ